jgi:hypothetical protein
VSRWTLEQVNQLPERARARVRAAIDAGAAEQRGAQNAELARKIASEIQKESPLVLELAGHLRLLGFKIVAPSSYSGAPLELVTEYRFHDTRKWRFDLASPTKKIGVEVDGSIFNAENGKAAGKHSRGAGMLRDMEKRNAASEIGWRLLVYGPPMIRSGEAAAQIARMVAQPLQTGAQPSD